MPLQMKLTDHFTVVCLVAWPLNESEVGVDLVLIETSLLLLCKLIVISLRTVTLTQGKQGGSIKKSRHQPHLHSKARQRSTQLSIVYGLLRAAV